jgi:hypothetical protein
MQASRIKHWALNAALAVALVLGMIGMGQAAIQPSSHASAASIESNGRALPILASAARTTTGTTSTYCDLGKFTKFAMQLVVTAASGTSPTLDLTWQHSIDGGTTWYTVATFTQATAATTALKAASEVEAATAVVLGDCMRGSYVIGGTTPSFTFSIDLWAE